MSIIIFYNIELIFEINFGIIQNKDIEIKINHKIENNSNYNYSYYKD